MSIPSLQTWHLFSLHPWGHKRMYVNLFGFADLYAKVAPQKAGNHFLRLRSVRVRCRRVGTLWVVVCGGACGLEDWSKFKHKHNKTSPASGGCLSSDSHPVSVKLPASNVCLSFALLIDATLDYLPWLSYRIDVLNATSSFSDKQSDRRLVSQAAIKCN